MHGEARVGSWSVGVVVGPNRLTATSPGLPPITFAVEAVPGAPSRLAVEAAARSAAVGSTIEPLVVTAHDANGNPIVGVELTFAVAAGDGTIERARAVTDKSGKASPGRWVLGTRALENHLVVRLGDLVAGWLVRAVPGPATRVVALVDTQQVAARSTAVAQAPAVRVVDAFGNGVPGTRVAFSAQGSVHPFGTGGVTDSAGTARMDSVVMHAVPGDGLVTASAPGLGPVGFTYTGVGLTDATRIYTKEDGTCALVRSGVGFCWGHNQFGEHGNGSMDSSATPRGIGGPARFSDLGIMYGATCGIRDTDGAAFCWGRNDYGELGFAARGARIPRQVNLNQRFRQLAGAYGSPVCGLTDGGEIWCWPGFGVEPIKRLNVSMKFTALFGGGYHYCALDASAAAWCWAASALPSLPFPPLGDGTTTASFVPVQVRGGVRFASISVGYTHSCGIDTSGEVWCWGSNGSGQIGDGTYETRLQPVRVQSSKKFVRIDAGTQHTCGIDVGGEALCWGANPSGLLGDGGSPGAATPIAVAGGLTFREISAGTSHTCGISSVGGVWCWGLGVSGSLGDGATRQSLVPVAVVP